MRGGSTLFCVMGCPWRGRVPSPNATNQEIVDTLCNVGRGKWHPNDAVGKMVYAMHNPDELTAAQIDEQMVGQDCFPVGKVRAIGMDLLHYVINVPGKNFSVPLAWFLLGHTSPLPQGK